MLVKVSDTVFHREEGGRGDEELLLPQTYQGDTQKYLPRLKINRKEAMKAESRPISANYSLTTRQPLLESTGTRRYFCWYLGTAHSPGGRTSVRLLTGGMQWLPFLPGNGFLFLVKMSYRWTWERSYKKRAVCRIIALLFPTRAVCREEWLRTLLHEQSVYFYHTLPD